MIKNTEFQSRNSIQVLGVADLLFGIVSPAARLTATMLPANFVNEVPLLSPASARA